MAERSPVFLGLIRPPRLLGLPIFHAMLWIFGTVLALIWSQSLLTFGVAAAVYPALWMAAEWDPNFMDVIRVVSQNTRPTKNRDVWDGDSYAP